MEVVRNARRPECVDDLVLGVGLDDELLDDAEENLLREERRKSSSAKREKNKTAVAKGGSGGGAEDRRWRGGGGRSGGARRAEGPVDKLRHAQLPAHPPSRCRRSGASRTTSGCSRPGEERLERHIDGADDFALNEVSESARGGGRRKIRTGETRRAEEPRPCPSP